MLISVDVDYYFFCLMDDLTREQCSYVNHAWHDLANTKQLWFTLCHQHYHVPSCGFNEKEYKALYYKLKYNKWNDIVMYTTLKDNHILRNYIYNNCNYSRWLSTLINNIIKTYNFSHHFSLLIPYCNLFYNHYYYLYKASLKVDAWYNQVHQMQKKIGQYDNLKIYKEYFDQYTL